MIPEAEDSVRGIKGSLAEDSAQRFTLTLVRRIPTRTFRLIPEAVDSVRGIKGSLDTGGGGFRPWYLASLHTRGGGFRPRYVGVTGHPGRRIPSLNTGGGGFRPWY